MWVAVIINTSADAMSERLVAGILGPVFGPFETDDEADAAAKQWREARPFTLDVGYMIVQPTKDVQSMIDFDGHPHGMAPLFRVTMAVEGSVTTRIPAMNAEQAAQLATNHPGMFDQDDIKVEKLTLRGVAEEE